MTGWVQDNPGFVLAVVTALFTAFLALLGWLAKGVRFFDKLLRLEERQTTIEERQTTIEEKQQHQIEGQGKDLTSIKANLASYEASLKATKETLLTMSNQLDRTERAVSKVQEDLSFLRGQYARTSIT